LPALNLNTSFDFHLLIAGAEARAFKCPATRGSCKKQNIFKDAIAGIANSK
jgi:hypothetical protein